MAKEKTVKAIQITPIENGWIVNFQESTPLPQQPPKIYQNYYETASEACQHAAEFLEPNVVQIVTGNN